MPFPDYLAKGEKITADHYHEVTRAARAQMGGGGFADNDGGIADLRRKLPLSIPIYNSYETIPKNSVLQLKPLHDESNDLIIHYTETVATVSTAFDGLNIIDFNDSNRILVTNDSEDMGINTQHAVTVIPFDRPIKVKVDITNPPLPGEVCGVVPRTTNNTTGGEVKVSRGNTGLICLSVPDDNELIEVVASRGGNREPAPYIITEVGYGDANVAVYRGSQLAVKGKKAYQPFSWEIVPDTEEKLLDCSTLRGVVFTGQLVLTSKVQIFNNTGSQYPSIIGGWGGEIFHDCEITEGIAPGATGIVNLKYLDVASVEQIAPVVATNSLPFALVADQVADLVTFSDAMQTFKIIVVSCP